MKTKKLKQKDIGRFVRVFFDCVGATDGILTQVNGHNDFRFLPLGPSDGDQTNNGAPAIKLGSYVWAKDSGLD